MVTKRFFLTVVALVLLPAALGAGCPSRTEVMEMARASNAEFYADSATTLANGVASSCGQHAVLMDGLTNAGNVIPTVREHLRTLDSGSDEARSLEKLIARFERALEQTKKSLRSVQSELLSASPATAGGGALRARLPGLLERSSALGAAGAELLGALPEESDAHEGLEEFTSEGLAALSRTLGELARAAQAMDLSRTWASEQ